VLLQETVRGDARNARNILHLEEGAMKRISFMLGNCPPSADVPSPESFRDCPNIPVEAVQSANTWHVIQLQGLCAACVSGIRRISRYSQRVHVPILYFPNSPFPVPRSLAPIHAHAINFFCYIVHFPCFLVSILPLHPPRPRRPPFPTISRIPLSTRLSLLQP